MAKQYTELYKKHRPRTWDDLVGQDAVVDDLRKAVINDKIPTAYLFAGKQHGCGKTSAAFIMAKAVNCENLDEETGNPCNECNTCKSIDAGTQMGVNYVSMANNGSVADANKIVTQAKQMQPVKQQVWILDEAHRMSKEAAEAWLIPLESEDMDTLFIFCSTEPERIIDTVKSRLQQRSFRSIDVKDIALHLNKISKLEGFDITNEQIMTAAMEASGSLRDAMSNLETIANGGTLTSSYKNKILSMLASRNYVKALEVAGEMEEDGQDFVQATEQLFRDFSDMLLILAGAKPSNNATNPNAYKQFAQGIGPQGIMLIISTLGDALTTMVYNNVDNRILFEVHMMKIITIIKQATK